MPFAVRYNLKERKERFEKQRQEYCSFLSLGSRTSFRSLWNVIQNRRCLILTSASTHNSLLRFTCEKSQKFIMVLKIIKDKIEKLQKAETGKPLKNDGKSSFFLYVGSSIPHGDQ